MNLAQLFHTRWLHCVDLNRLLPVGKVLAGAYFVVDPGTRYATITLPGSRTAGLPGRHPIRETATVRVRIHHDDYLLGRAVVQVALGCFDGCRLEALEAQRAFQIRRAREPEEMQDPRTAHWDWIIDFHCRVESLLG